MSRSDGHRRVLSANSPSLAIICSLLAALVLPAAAQFKSGAQMVAVYTTVTDIDGRLVPDLTQDVFEVYDNGKLQPITTFANDIQPITIVVMLDRSASMLANFRLVQRAAEAFVDKLLAADKARIGSFADRVQLDPRDFSGDKGELLGILRTELQAPGPTPLWNAVGVGMTALLHQQGRRVVLVFTDGMDNPMNGRSNNVSLREVMKRADEEDVMVYGIGLAGDPTGGFGGGRTYGRRGGRRAQVDKPDPGLARVAAASGGGYFELTSTNNLQGTFARVADELHRQYLLGFVPQNLDGKSHKLEVRIKIPGMTPRARKSYVAKKAS